MHASRSRTRARTVPIQIWIPSAFLGLGTILTLIALSTGHASGATPTGKTTAADSAAGGGFTVRVREEGATSKITAAERTRRAVEQA